MNTVPKTPVQQSQTIVQIIPDDTINIRKSPTIVLIDGKNIFTHCLTDLFTALGYSVHTLAITESCEKIQTAIMLHQPHVLCLAGGRSSPEIINQFHQLLNQISNRTILGIGSGMHAIATFFGGALIKNRHRHGEACLMTHQQEDFLAEINNQTRVSCYYSAITQVTGTSLQVLACQDNAIPMIIRHSTQPVYGFQFHPESLLTTESIALMAAFLRHV